MNQKQFLEFCRKYERLFNMGFVAIEGAVRLNSNESLNHFMKKAEYMYRLKEGWSAEECANIKTGWVTVSTNPKWYSPRVYTEVRVGKNVFDIVAILMDGAYVIEVAESEGEASLKRKERNAINLGFKFVKMD